MKIEYKDGNIVITVPYEAGKEYPKSSTGKSRMVGTSSGFLPVAGTPDSVKVNFSIIEVIPKDKR